MCNTTHSPSLWLHPCLGLEYQTISPRGIMLLGPMTLLWGSQTSTLMDLHLSMVVKMAPLKHILGTVDHMVNMDYNILNSQGRRLETHIKEIVDNQLGQSGRVRGGSTNKLHLTDPPGLAPVVKHS
ncbi:hypothetical protein AMTR_s00018p00247190 [Amborella trichopoda]|uniref:Uncharacterized protein n=1 Tax=Amborella trichopoda TaxID=13333 RepID=W1PM85_AMBTC|nr:hypothetical protein AMTR_s00018p00247190 [Amborella trichopoda]